MTERVIPALEARGHRVKWTGDKGTSTCPVHDDQHASLSLRREDDRALLNCFVGCPPEEVVAALGLEMKDLFDDEEGRPKRNGRRAPAHPGALTTPSREPAAPLRHDDLGVPVLAHEIRGNDGSLFAVHARFETPGGKTFRWWRDGGWTLGGAPVEDAPLYRSERMADGRPVVVTEGEKKADSLALAAPGLCVVATACGAKTTPSAQVLEVLRGRDVTLWPDNDVAGVMHMEKIASALSGVAKTVKTIDIAAIGLPAKGDAADWLELHDGADDVTGLVLALKATQTGPLIYTSEQFVALVLPPLDHVLDPIVRVKNIAMLYAPRGSGKTWVVLSLGLVIAAGGVLFDRWRAKKGRHVLLVDGEMPAQTLQERVAALERGMGLAPQGRLRILAADLQEAAIPSLATPPGQAYVDGALTPETEVVILDNISTLCGGVDENDAEAWGPVQSWLLSLRRRGLTVILVHHAGKGGQQRGTSKHEDVIDLTLALKLPKDYEPEEGARFEIHYEKTRGIFGSAVETFEAQLVTSSNGAHWTVRNIRAETLKRMVELEALGWSQRAIAKELGVDVSNVNRKLKKAKEQPGGAS